MAIKINITAKVANLNQIRSQIESKLKGLNVGGSKSGKEASWLKMQTDNAKKLTDQYKALEITRKQYLQGTNSIIQSVKNEDQALSLRAKLTQDTQRAIKSEVTERKSLEKFIKATTEAKKQELAVSEKARVLKAQYDMGKISLKAYVAEANKLIAANKNNSKELTTLASLQRNVNSAMKEASSVARKRVQDEIKEIEVSKAKNLQLRQEQQSIAALNRIKRATDKGIQAKEIKNIEAYNAAVKRSIELYKAGKLETKEFLAITQQLQAQKMNMANMDNRIAASWNSAQKTANNDLRRRVQAQERLNNSLLTQNQNVGKANKGLKAYLGNLGMIVKKFADWILVGSIVFIPIRAIQDAVTTIIEMDDALTDLNKVVELSRADMEDMKNTAVEFGKAMGVSSTEIMKGMAEFGRIAKSTDDIKELTEVATRAANVTTMTADEAAKAITTTMITFKKEVSDASHIVDSFNEIQNNYRTSAEDLAGSIEKVGAAARISGVSMESLSGYTTAIVSATGQTGSEVGTALKTVISRMYRIGTEGANSAGKAEEALAGIGVAVRDTSKEFRDFDSIINDLSGVWDDLNNVQKMNVSQAIAGKLVPGGMVTYLRESVKSVKLLAA